MRAALLPALILLALAPLAQAQDPAPAAVEPANPLVQIEELRDGDGPAVESRETVLDAGVVVRTQRGSGLGIHSVDVLRSIEHGGP